MKKRKKKIKNIIIGILILGGILLISSLVSGPSGQEVAREEIIAPALPDKLPGNVPIYPASTVNSSRESEDEESTNFSLSLSAKSSIDEINTWYREAFEQNGWSIKSDKNVAGYQIIQAENRKLFSSMQAANSNQPGTVTISQSVKIRK